MAVVLENRLNKGKSLLIPSSRFNCDCHSYATIFFRGRSCLYRSNKQQLTKLEHIYTYPAIQVLHRTYHHNYKRCLDVEDSMTELTVKLRIWC